MRRVTVAQAMFIVVFDVCFDVVGLQSYPKPGTPAAFARKAGSSIVPGSKICEAARAFLHCPMGCYYPSNSIARLFDSGYFARRHSWFQVAATDTVDRGIAIRREATLVDRFTVSSDCSGKAFVFAAVTPWLMD